MVLDAPNMEFLFGLDMLRKHQVAPSICLVLMAIWTFGCWSLPGWICSNFSLFMQCIIDLKENVLRMGGGEVSVPFLQGWSSVFAFYFVTMTVFLLYAWFLSVIWESI
jgi:DNA damage-inducible protein 1